jgi:HCOMODA/2-hydroxy-3-carboxy-muconic semialdehyde decarboxylase
MTLTERFRAQKDPSMNALERAKRDLVIANRVLVQQDVLDASGHVSIRHPDDPSRFLISRSVSPGMVKLDDILTLSLEGKPEPGETRPLYVERFIHAAIYAARPDVNAVVHAHTDDVLPFTISSVPMRPVFHGSSDMGAGAPVWEIREKFGDATRLLVANMDHGRDLAAKLGQDSVVLMRGHGFAAALQSIILIVRVCIELPKNARVLTAAMALAGKAGQVTGISPAEIAIRRDFDPNSSAVRRGWEHYAIRAGCKDLLAD